MEYTGSMAKKKKTRWTRARLLALGIPAVLIPGILASIMLGWNPKVLFQTKNYYANKRVFPDNGVVQNVTDGDTFTLQSGAEVRMLGIDAPGR